CQGHSLRTASRQSVEPKSEYIKFIHIPPEQPRTGACASVSETSGSLKDGIANLAQRLSRRSPPKRLIEAMTTGAMAPSRSKDVCAISLWTRQGCSLCGGDHRECARL